MMREHQTDKLKMFKMYRKAVRLDCLLNLVERFLLSIAKFQSGPG